MPQFEVEGEFEVLAFSGVLTGGPVSTRPHPVSGLLRARWTKLALYRKDDGEYVLHKVNYSRVWHGPDGAGHVRAPAQEDFADLPPDAVYCGIMPSREGRVQCPRQPPGTGLVITELPQYSAWKCPDYAAVIARLSQAYKRVNVGAENGPVHLLLDQAAEADPAFRDALKPVVRI